MKRGRYDCKLHRTSGPEYYLDPAALTPFVTTVMVRYGPDGNSDLIRNFLPSSPAA
jgi:hypothetical protein